MNKEDLKKRTKEFAKAIIKMVEQLPNKRVGWTITDQIVRSSTSVAANYRAVCRAKSDKDFIHKMGTVIEEADETHFWLELIDELQLIDQKSSIKNLLTEADELVAIFVASSKTVKNRLNQKSKINNHKLKR